MGPKEFNSMSEIRNYYFPKSKLENLAEYLTKGKYIINSDKDKPEIGSIKYGLKDPWIFFDEAKIEEKVKKFYSEENYTILISNSNNEVNIHIMEKFFGKINLN